MSTFYGADVSRWQGDVNWPAFNPGAAFVFIKAGGGDDGLYTDGKFYQNRDGVRSLGSDMPHGYYWFAGGGDPIGEANYFCDLLPDLQTGEVLVLDWEISPGFNHDEWCARFINQVKARTGITPLFYTNQNRVVSEDWSQTVATGCGLWVAHYGIGPDGDVPIKWWPFYAFHQYSSSGSFPGISGRVDTNAFFADAITDFYKYGKQSVVLPPVIAPPLPPLVPPVEPTPLPEPTVPPVVALPQEASIWDSLITFLRAIIGWLLNKKG